MQGQVCAQHPTTANPTRPPWLANGGNPFRDAPHPFQDAPHPPPERPNLAGKFLGRQRSRLGVPLLVLGVTPSAPDAVLAAHDNVPPVGVDRG